MLQTISSSEKVSPRPSGTFSVKRFAVKNCQMSPNIKDNMFIMKHFIQAS